MKSHLKQISFLLILPLFLFCSFLSFSPTAHAQTPSSIDGIEITTNPTIPAPGQNFTVSVESFATDLNGASIVWILNGKVFAQGTGVMSIKTFAPALGKQLTIAVAIRTIEGREVKKSITIRPAGVDLVWESGGYTPPFYRGKALFIYENPIKLIAMPHLTGSNGAELDPRTLIYKWKKGEQVVLEQSGYGKQTFTFQDDIPRPIDIEVHVSTRTGNAQAVGTMTLTPGDPSITFYEENPLYGVLYNKAILNAFSLTDQEVMIRAVPYNFNSPNKGSHMSYLWSINNLERPDLSKNQSIVLRTSGDDSGTSNISLDVRNMREILQGARNRTNVNFNKKTK